MSIKIYYGMRAAIPEGGLFELADRVRFAVHHAIRPFYVSKCAFEFAMDQERNPDREMRWPFKELAAQESEAEDCQVALIRNPADTSTVLLMPFGWPGELGAITEQILALVPRSEMWGYWNNVDPEQGVSEADWAVRRATWAQALFEPNRTPAQVGLLVHPALDWHQVCLEGRQQWVDKLAAIEEAAADAG